MEKLLVLFHNREYNHTELVGHRLFESMGDAVDAIFHHAHSCDFEDNELSYTKIGKRTYKFTIKTNDRVIWLIQPYNPHHLL